MVNDGETTELKRRSQGVRNPHWYVSSTTTHEHSMERILEPLLTFMLGGAGNRTCSTRGRLGVTHATIIVSPLWVTTHDN